MIKISNIYKHFKKICVHKYWVSFYCNKAGIPWQGIIHDLSKFSPTEFWESVKYYQGGSSPIDACKKDKGYSMAWFHHRGRNKHHYEMWVDDFDHGGHPLLMPYKYAVELICDYLAAGRAYMGKNFTYKKEYEWWKNKQTDTLAMHPAIQTFVELVLSDLMEKEQFNNWKDEPKKTSKITEKNNILKLFNKDYLYQRYVLSQVLERDNPYVLTIGGK